MTLKTRLVRLSLLSLLSVPLVGAKINAQLSQSVNGSVVLPSYEIDGTDVVPLVVQLAEDPAKPGDYVGNFWPNTRGLKGTRWLINVAAGELLMKTLNLTVIDGSSAVEVPLTVMVDAPPYPQVFPSSQVVSVTQGYADAAGHSASVAAEKADETLASLNDFKSRYYGALAADPALDPLGAAVTTGDAYFNTTYLLFKVYNGATWQASDINTANLAGSSGVDLIGINGHTLRQVVESGTGATEKRPAFVETFVPIRSMPAVPANIATYQTGGDSGQYSLTVTAGASGALAASVAESAIVAGMGVSPWPCAIEHRDGTHSFNIVSSGSGSTVNLRFPLPKAASFISPTWDALNGQHMTKRGYRALADLVFSQTAGQCTATRFLGNGCYVNQPPVYQQLWTANAALTAYGVVNVNNVVSSMTVDTLTGNINGPQSLLARSSVAPCGINVGVHATGHGVTGSIATYRQRGFIETHVYTTAGASTTPSQVGSATLNAYGVVGGVEYLIFTKTFSDFLERAIIPFDGFESVRLEAVAAANYAFFMRVMDTKAWISEAADVPLIGKNSKVVTIGDSWFEFYGPTNGAVTTGLGAFSTRLQEAMRAVLGTGVVVNKSKAGMTTEWALAWFDSYVLPENPDQVIFNFFTNDANTSSATATFLGPTGATLNNRILDSNHWRANIAKLSAKCAAAGIQAVFILPSGTASLSQAQNQMVWRRTLRQGILADAIPRALSSELADTTAFINVFGKYAGKSAAVGAAIFYAQGASPADSWRNTQNERIANLEVQAYDFSVSDKNVAKIGTDTNADGWSDGVTLQGWGNNTGTTFTPSISAGVQLLTVTYTNPVGTGSGRQKYDFTCVAGRDYFLIAEFSGCTPSTAVDLIGSFYGGAVNIGATAPGGNLPTGADGKITKYWRFGAVTATANYFSCNVLGARTALPVTYVTGVKRINLIDLTDVKARFGIDPASMTDVELFSLLNAALTRVPPLALQVTDSVTGAAKKIVINSGSLVVQ